MHWHGAGLIPGQEQKGWGRETSTQQSPGEAAGPGIFEEKRIHYILGKSENAVVRRPYRLTTDGVVLAGTGGRCYSNFLR